jgi:hypothetical protein
VAVLQGLIGQRMGAAGAVVIGHSAQPIVSVQIF